MEATSTLTVSEIIGRAGGPRAIADASQQSREPFSKDAVYKWAKGGIPDRHWPIIIALTGLQVAQIYEANVARRGVTFPMPVLEAAE